MHVRCPNKLGSFTLVDVDNCYIYYNIFHITIPSCDICAHILNICDSMQYIAKYLTIAKCCSGLNTFTNCQIF